jgi:tetratricopeptide (TPR) repeat protein
MNGMEEMRAALAAKGYDIVGTADGSDSDDDPMPGRIPSLAPDVAREKGKAAFEQGKYDKAIKYWQGGLKNILSSLCAGPEALSNQNLSELDLTLNLNIAMAYMKKGDYEAADRSVDKALARRDALPPHQITKALYRKASALRAMNKLDETLEALKDLLEVDPANAAALKMKQEVDREWNRQKRAQKENLKKLFSKMQDQDQKAGELARKERAEARRRGGVQWTADDVDAEAFERGDAPACDGRDWGLALSRTVLWSLEELAVELAVEELEAIMPPDATRASAWFLGVSSTCEFRWLQPSAILSRLPSLSLLELVLIGFLGEKDPDNKFVPDPNVDSLPRGILEKRIQEDPLRRVLIRCVKGTMQDALEKELKSANMETSQASSGTAEAADAPATASASSQAAGSSSASLEVAATASSKETPADVGASEAPDGSKVEGAAEDENLAPMPPSVCFIAHPHLHRYFSDFYPAIAWLIEKKVPTIIIGSSEPDLSWRQDEILLKALGANIVVSKRESPYPMCLPDNPLVKKCNHIIGFLGGKALEKDKLTRTKIDLLAQDYTVC